MLRQISQDTPEWPAFIVALAGAHLPASDLAGAGQQFFSLNSAAAFGGYFVAGANALLRSIVVPPSARGRGLGQAIVTALLRQLEDQGVARAWLLTTTAQPFFERLGFVPVDRNSAPMAISTTPQFQGICPGSAAFMCRSLTPATPNQEASA